MPCGHNFCKACLDARFAGEATSVVGGSGFKTLRARKVGLWHTVLMVVVMVVLMVVVMVVVVMVVLIRMMTMMSTTTIVLPMLVMTSRLLVWSFLSKAGRQQLL